MLLSVSLPATLYPTIEVQDDQWRKAVEALETGEKLVLFGACGGSGCRGEQLEGGLGSFRLLSAGPPGAKGVFQAEFLSGPIADSLWFFNAEDGMEHGKLTPEQHAKVFTTVVRVR